MVRGYYESLALTRSASLADVKKAYRKLSLKHHPERAAGPKIEAELAFSEISEAYDVLSNPARRAIYDQYGEKGLKEGVPDGQGGVKGGKYRYNNNAVEIFSAFFGTSSPFADILGTTGEEPPSFYGELTGMQLPFAKSKAPAIVAPLAVTLAEVYNGADKVVMYTRKKVTEEGVTIDEHVESQIYVKPGSDEGVIAVLEGLGDQGVHYLPGDVEIELSLLPDECASHRHPSLRTHTHKHAHPQARTTSPSLAPGAPPALTAVTVCPLAQRTPPEHHTHHP